MIFVDTNVIMYSVGGEHALRQPCRTFFEDAVTTGERLVTSAEVIQELMHAYLSVERYRTLDNALQLIDRAFEDVWPLEYEDVILARQLQDQFPYLTSRDLCHLASCRRRGVTEIKTYDRALAATR